MWYVTWIGPPYIQNGGSKPNLDRVGLYWVELDTGSYKGAEAIINDKDDN